jgi:hypothetical protein
MGYQVTLPSEKRREGRFRSATRLEKPKSPRLAARVNVFLIIGIRVSLPTRHWLVRHAKAAVAETPTTPRASAKDLQNYVSGLDAL